MAVIIKAKMKDCELLAHQMKMLKLNNKIEEVIPAQELFDNGEYFYMKIRGKVDCMLANDPYAIGISPDIFRKAGQALLMEWEFFVDEYEEIPFRSALKAMADEYLEEGYDMEWDKNPLEALKKFPAECEEYIVNMLEQSQQAHDEEKNPHHPHPWAIYDFIQEAEGKRKVMKTFSLKEMRGMKQENEDPKIKWVKVNDLAYTDIRYWDYAIMSKQEFYNNRKMFSATSSIQNTNSNIKKLLGIDESEDKSRDESWGTRERQIINKQGKEAIAYYIQIASECNALDNKDDDLIRAIQEEGLAGYEKTLGGEIADMLNTYPTDTPRKKLKEKAPLEIQEFIVLKRNRIPKKA